MIKKGGKSYPQSLIQGFNDVLEDCSFIDMDLQGYPFTWERGAGTADWIEVRLDRALFNLPFLNIFTDARIINLEVSTSDHCPIIMELEKVEKVAQQKRFRFENAWLREPVCQQIVEDVWTENPLSFLFEKLETCSNFYQCGAKKLLEASSNVFKDVKNIKSYEGSKR